MPMRHGGPTSKAVRCPVRRRPVASDADAGSLRSWVDVPDRSADHGDIGLSGLPCPGGRRRRGRTTAGDEIPLDLYRLADVYGDISGRSEVQHEKGALDAEGELRDLQVPRPRPRDQPGEEPEQSGGAQHACRPPPTTR